MERWNDDRLDDFYEEFRRMVVIVERVGSIETSLARVAEDAASCRASLHKVRSDMTATALQLANDRRADREAELDRRKKDRRWLIGILLSATAIVVAAMGVLVNHL